jgi:hypothetical protein
MDIRPNTVAAALALALAGGLAIGGASLASAQEPTDDSTTTTVVEDDTGATDDGDDSTTDDCPLRDGAGIDDTGDAAGS